MTIWRRSAEPPPQFEFFAVFDHSRALGKCLENRTNRNILWDFRSGDVADLPTNAKWSDPVAAMLLPYGWPADAVRDLPI
jgi:hypothetical protein